MCEISFQEMPRLVYIMIPFVVPGICLLLIIDTLSSVVLVLVMKKQNLDLLLFVQKIEFVKFI
jgi:hypothetical protein